VGEPLAARVFGGRQRRRRVRVDHVAGLEEDGARRRAPAPGRIDDPGLRQDLAGEVPPPVQVAEEDHPPGLGRGGEPCPLGARPALRVPALASGGRDRGRERRCERRLDRGAAARKQPGRRRPARFAAREQRLPRLPGHRERQRPLFADRLHVAPPAGL
jgi:hypothetical protein